MNENNQKVALITGITGQDGSYLAELLTETYHNSLKLINNSLDFYCPG
jgi:GDP-D-mannose dehydratase